MNSHLCENFLKFALSLQERDVATQITKLLEDNEDHFDIKDVRDKVTIEQHSHFSAIITRLVTKGVLIRLQRGKYSFADCELVQYIKEKE